MAKKYKTAGGKMVDIETLRLANEGTLAIGNMNVNAAGDLIGKGGQVIKTRTELLKEYYALHTMVPTESIPAEKAPNKNK